MEDRKLTPFDYVKAIGDPKKPWPSPSMEGYNGYMVNRALAYHGASIIQANAMNQRHALPADMQFAYLSGSIKPGRRWAKWVSQTKDDKVALIAEIYDTNYVRARQILSLLNEKQIETILQMNGGLENADGAKKKTGRPSRGKTDGDRKVPGRARNAKKDRNPVK